jgi:hypothetical protein
MENSQSTAKATITVAIALAVSTYFAQTDAKKEVYSTADGFIFENLVFAKNHAATLDDKNVTPHTNANNLEVVDEEEVTGSGTPYQLTDADKQLFETGLSKDNYNALKSLIKSLKIETSDQKAETLIKALEEYKTNNPIA